MQLVDEGLLDLDTPVVEVLPELRLVRPRRHQAASPSGTCSPTPAASTATSSPTPAAATTASSSTSTLLADAAQNHPLGATWSYCNSGFSLLGRVIEKLTGKTWDAAMRERLFTPLGLTHTGHAARGGDPATPPPSATSTRTASRSPRRSWGLPRSLGPAGLITADASPTCSPSRACT